MNRIRGPQYRIALTAGILCLLAALLGQSDLHAASPVQQIQKMLVQHRDRVAATIEKEWYSWGKRKDHTQDAVIDLLSQSKAWDILGEFYNRLQSQERKPLLDALLKRLYASTDRDSLVMFARDLESFESDELFERLLEDKRWDLLANVIGIPRVLPQERGSLSLSLHTKGPRANDLG